MLFANGVLVRSTWLVTPEQLIGGATSDFHARAGVRIDVTRSQQGIRQKNVRQKDECDLRKHRLNNHFAYSIYLSTDRHIAPHGDTALPSFMQVCMTKPSTHFASAHISARNLQSRHAFTLIEMVVACVLLSVLLVAVVSVWRVLLNENRQLKQSQAAVLPESLARQLRRDVINARSYRQRGEQLELLGYVDQDAASGQALLTLAMANYHIRPTIQGGVLFRSQLSASTTTAVMTTAGSMVQPLWRGARAIRLTSNTIDTGDVSLLSPEVIESFTAGTMADSSGWIVLPPVVEVMVLGEQGQVLFRESIVRSEGT